MSPPASSPAATAWASLYRWSPFLLSGLLLALAFPCHPRHPLAFLFNAGWAYVGLIPLLLALPGGFKQGFCCGWVSGFIFNLLGLYWVAHTQGGGLAVVGGTALMAAYLGLFTGVFAGCQALFQQQWGIWAALLAPVVWTAQEYLLSLGELGFPWLLLGHTQAVYPQLIQYAAFTGVYGVSCWVVLVNALGALVLSGSLWPALRLAAGGGLVLCFLLPWIYSWVVINSAPTAGPMLRVGLVQPNLGMEKWGMDGLELSFTTLETLSRRAAEQRPQLLVWPETALPCYVSMRPHCRERVEQLVRELQVPLLTGAPDRDSLTGEPYNAAFFFQPDQAALQSYAKMHLVPFGERTPFRDAIPLLRDLDWAALTGDLGPAEFAPGRSRTLFAHPQAPFAVLICFEAVFPDLVRRSVDGGAQLLVNITNDSWFGQTAGPYQHAQLAAMRAVENRTPMARCATSGVSVFIDPFGRSSQATETFVEDARVGALPVGQGGTFYTRQGDLFAQFMLLVGALCLLAASRTLSRQNPQHG